MLLRGIAYLLHLLLDRKIQGCGVEVEIVERKNKKGHQAKRPEQ